MPVRPIRLSGCQAVRTNIAASAASPSGHAGSRRSWLRLHCVGMRKHVQNASRPSPPCPLNPCPPLLPFRATPNAAKPSLFRDLQQVHVDRRLAWLPSALWRRLEASKRARRPCCCQAPLQLAGGGASCAAAMACSGPPEPAPGLSQHSPVRGRHAR